MISTPQQGHPSVLQWLPPAASPGHLVGRYIPQRSPGSSGAAQSSPPGLASGWLTVCRATVVTLVLRLLTRRSMRTARATAPNKPANVIHVAKPISPQTVRRNSVTGRVRDGSVRVLQGRARPCGSLSQRGVRHSHRVTHHGLHGGCHLVLEGGASFGLSRRDHPAPVGIAVPKGRWWPDHRDSPDPLRSQSPPVQGAGSGLDR